MRFGGPVFADCSTPKRWIEALQAKGYRAAYCPLDERASDDTVAAYARAAAEADIVIAEVGVWNNPIARDETARQKAIAFCKTRLALADRLGARCCVNVAGSRHTEAAGVHPDNLSQETFDLIVETTRGIIDAVKPKRTFYTLEPMPYVFPDTADNYLRLLATVQRERFGVHLDLVNVVTSPQKYMDSGALVREWCKKLGPRIRSCHAKDILLSRNLTVHLDEARPGLGNFDFAAFLRELDQLDPDLPVMLEHLPNEAEYDLAAAHVRAVAREVGVRL